ncbi:MAG: LysM peptidoglycan-binding domain-containing protein [Planctomycetota bacterium]
MRWNPQRPETGPPGSELAATTYRAALLIGALLLGGCALPEAEEVYPRSPSSRSIAGITSEEDRAETVPWEGATPVRERATAPLEAGDWRPQRGPAGAGGEAFTSAEPAGSTATDSYVVRRGDTLYGIARRFYGDGREWKRIYEANRSLIARPERIQVGMILILP